MTKQEEINKELLSAIADIVKVVIFNHEQVNTTDITGVDGVLLDHVIKLKTIIEKDNENSI